MILTAGKVIQTGTETSGARYTYLLIFLIVGVSEVVEVDRMLSSEITPPMIGRIPYGSGALRSLNQRNPSVRILGFKS
jgi:hypothetical protein